MDRILNQVMRTDVNGDPGACAEDQNRTDDPYLGPGRRLWALLALVALTVGTILCINAIKIPVETAPFRSGGTIDYQALVKRHSDVASNRNIEALRRFEADVDQACRGLESGKDQMARDAARDAAEYGACCKIIYLLAKDTVTGREETEAYLKGKILPHVDPALETAAKDLDMAVLHLEYALRSSTVAFANDLAALGPGAHKPVYGINFRRMTHADMAQALRNLGLNSLILAVSGGFDVAMLVKLKIPQRFLKAVIVLAGRVFRKQLAKTIASAAAALVDGPLPIGDIVAGIGVIWTGYDIYSSQKEFESDLNITVGNLLSEAAASAGDRSREYGTAMVKQFREMQKNIGSESLKQLGDKGGN